MSLLRDAAAYIHRFAYENLSPRETEKIKACLADWIGVTLSGSGEAVSCRTRDFAAPDTGRNWFPGPGAEPGAEGEAATVLGTTRLASPLAAALCNGVAGHALDYDDVTMLGSGHPSSPVMPPALALGELLDASGREVMAAMAAGFAVELGLGLPIMPGHYDRGHHNTATLGRLGAAAAAGVLRRLSAERCEAALSIAATTSAGLRAGFGTMLKSLQVGWAAMGGLLSAELAGSGVTGASDILEGRSSLYTTLAPAVDASAVDFVSRAMKPGAEPALSSCVLDSVLLKAYPSCWSTHGAIISALKLRSRVNELGGPPAVRDLRCVIHPQCLAVAADPAPSTGLAAKFSAQYCLALALVDGRVRLDSFTDESVSRPDVGRLGGVVQLIAEKDFAKFRDCELTITMAGGETLTSRTRIFETLSAQEEWASARRKLEEGCELAFGSPGPAKGIAEAVLHLERLRSIRELTGLLRQAAKK